jgi:hypothetical protein
VETVVVVTVWTAVTVLVAGAACVPPLHPERTMANVVAPIAPRQDRVIPSPPSNPAPAVCAMAMPDTG